MFISPMIEYIINNHYEYIVDSIGMRAKLCLICSIYKKGLRLSSTGKKDFTTGEVVNLIAVDSQWIMNYISVANLIWAIPFQIGIALYLLWAQLGISVLAGIGIMILTFPINTYISSKLKDSQVTVMEEKDKRIRVMNEILNGIKVLKLYAWENSFKDYVMNFRSKEMKYLRKQEWLDSGLTFVSNTTPFLVRNKINH
jgi:ABC-type bacteriocin/lantibiotic exporter with double-glycine peptidase domain